MACYLEGFTIGKLDDSLAKCKLFSFFYVDFKIFDTTVKLVHNVYQGMNK